MSGEKDAFVNLRRSQLDHLMNNARRTDDLECNVRTRVDRMSGELRSEVEKRALALESRAAAEARRVDGLSADLREFERDTTRKLREQADVFRVGLSELDRRLDGRIRSLGVRVERGFAEVDARLQAQRGEYLDVIAEQTRSFHERLDTQRRELQGQITNVHQSMQHRLQSQHKLADAWVADARALVESLASQHRAEKFAPGGIAALQSQLVLAEGNLRQEVFQAAIATAQQTYLEAVDLRLTLLAREEEYEAYLQAARIGADEVLALAEAQTTCQFLLETDQGSTAVEGRVNYWTGGTLDLLLSEASEERQRLLTSEAPGPERPHGLTIDDLKQTIGRNEQRRRACVLVVEHARQAILASQVRWQMGGIISDSLREAGWEIKQEAWQGDDQRGAFHVKLGNLAGDEVVSIIAPVEGADGIQNHLNVNFYDRSQNDESVRRHRLNTILRSLKQEGLDVTPPTCPPGTEDKSAGDERKLDIDAVKRTPIPVSPMRLK